MTARRVHWITDEGAVAIQKNATLPDWDVMTKYIGGHIEHVTVLYKGKSTAMYVHEEGRLKWEDRNEVATQIYFAASRARGIDPEDKEQDKRQAEAFAKSMGISAENIVYADDGGKQVGIYGPAILLEGFPNE